MRITPSFIISFETNLQGLVTGNWQRVASSLMWDKVMKLRPASGKVEIMTWLLETAQIRPRGNGGQTRFSDILAASTSMEIFDSGDALRLTRNEISDNQMESNPSVGALDYASKWAADAGAAAAYEPQKQLFKLIVNGGTGIGYDKVSYFNASHPVNPNGGTTTYSNVITGVPLRDATGTTEQDRLLIGRKNLGKALAQVSAQKFLGGTPRFLKPKTLLVPTADADYARLIVSAGVIGATSNVQNDGLEVIACPELDGVDTVGNYYIGVEDMLSDQLGALVWGEREAYQLSSLGPQTSASLSNMDMFQWTLKGRNTAMYGHPYMLYRASV